MRNTPEVSTHSRNYHRFCSAAIAAASVIILTACAQSKSIPLPDLPPKAGTGAPTQQTALTKAEQKKAIDDMIARRDRQLRATGATDKNQ